MKYKYTWILERLQVACLCVLLFMYQIFAGFFGIIIWKMANNKKHYTDMEKKFFLRILTKYSHIIERKRSDATTLKDKEEAWNQICDSYNISSITTSKVRNMHIFSN